MIFPKGQPVYENLNTSFTQLDAMLGELKNNQFTGYVDVTGWEYEGILMLDTGNVVGALEEAKGQRRTGPSAAESIAAKGREKDGAISVYRLPSDMIQLLMGATTSQAIYKDLSSDLTGLDKLVAKLQHEKHTGYIEIKIPKSESAATIFMREGTVLDCILTAKGETSTGANVLDQIILNALSENALFTVYRADLAEMYSNDANLADSFGRQSMLVLWQDVLKATEAAVDGATKGGTFNTTFKRACIAQASKYPFLDPFAAEFTYQNGVIKFDGQATIAQFNQGLCDCFAQAIRDASVNAKNITAKLQPVSTALKTSFGARLAEVGLTTALPELFGK
jgi:hypothetical protein